MAQGTRGRWMRAVVAGLGVTFSTGLVGCMNWDKPKDTKSTAAPKAGLPGTPTLPAGNTAAAGTPAQGRWTPGTGQFNGPGGNIQPNNFATGAPPRTGTNNLNTVGGAYPYGAPPAGTPGAIGAPVQPSVQPAGWPGGPVGAAPLTPAGGVASFSSPPPPDLLGGPLPPPAPPHPAHEFANTGGIAAPSGVAPIAPVAPTAPIPPIKNF